MATPDIPAPAGMTLAVDDVIADTDGSTVVAHHGSMRYRLHLPALGDESRARRFLATTRRVDRAIIDIDGDVVACTAVGRRTRRPFQTPVPLAVGLGLGLLGVPLRVTGIDQPAPP